MIIPLIIDYRTPHISRFPRRGRTLRYVKRLPRLTHFDAPRIVELHARRHGARLAIMLPAVRLFFYHADSRYDDIALVFKSNCCCRFDGG